MNCNKSQFYFPPSYGYSLYNIFPRVLKHFASYCNCHTLEELQIYGATENTHTTFKYHSILLVRFLHFQRFLVMMIWLRNVTYKKACLATIRDSTEWSHQVRWLYVSPRICVVHFRLEISCHIYEALINTKVLIQWLFIQLVSYCLLLYVVYLGITWSILYIRESRSI